MSWKTRPSYKPGACITEKPCKNRDKQCDKCIGKNLYVPEVNNERDIHKDGNGST